MELMRSIKLYFANIILIIKYWVVRKVRAAKDLNLINIY